MRHRPAATVANATYNILRLKMTCIRPSARTFRPSFFALAMRSFTRHRPAADRCERHLQYTAGQNTSIREFLVRIRIG